MTVVTVFSCSMLKDLDDSDKEKGILSTSEELLSKPEEMTTHKSDAGTSKDCDGMKTYFSYFKFTHTHTHPHTHTHTHASFKSSLQLQ